MLNLIPQEMLKKQAVFLRTKNRISELRKYLFELEARFNNCTSLNLSKRLKLEMLWTLSLIEVNEVVYGHLSKSSVNKIH